MLRRWRDRADITRGLGFRLGALLSIAILPLGLISVVQTLHLSREAERSAEIALLGRTASAAAGERALLQGALGTADALGPAVLKVLDDPEACAGIMRDLVGRNATYAYAGFVPLSGLTACTSAARTAPVDLRQSPAYRRFIEDPQTLMSVVDRGAVSGRSVVVVMQPLYRDADLLGYTAVSIARDLLRSTHETGYQDGSARIITFNNRGEVLTSDLPGETTARALLPAGVTVDRVLARSNATFRARTPSGEERVYAVVPVVPGLVDALGVWDPRSAGDSLTLARLSAVAIPIVLWAVSLAVAYFAVYRLVLRHIRELRGQMRRFAIGDRDAPPPVLTDAPAEIADVSQTFHNMARILIRDEEAMEAAVAEKTVLLKEVHHRVKNNLQLIASIINMQIRVISDNEAKRVLRSVQDRVAALATIYRNLYQAEQLDSVEADRLVADIIAAMIAAGAGTGLRVEAEIAPLTLLPDQAVPLSLLVTETLTNALKYNGVPAGATEAWVRVSLTTPAPSQVLYEIANSAGVRPQDDTHGEGTGLGGQLIKAFATQLDGEAEIVEAPDRYVLRLRFRALAVATPTPEDDRTVVLTSNPRAGASH